MGWAACRVGGLCHPPPAAHLSFFFLSPSLLSIEVVLFSGGNTIECLPFIDYFPDDSFWLNGHSATLLSFATLRLEPAAGLRDSKQSLMSLVDYHDYATVRPARLASIRCH